MDRQRIKEAARLKIEWCCEIPTPTFPLAMRDAIDAMHNAQATYVRYIRGVKYRGPGLMFVEPVANRQCLHITMRWLGSKAQAHFLQRRDPAFHVVGEEPKPLLIGRPTAHGTISAVYPDKAGPPGAGDIGPGIVVDLDDQKDEPAVAPIPASEGTGQPPEPGLEMQPPAEEPPKHDWPASIFGLRKMARELNVDVTDIKGRGAYNKIIERLEAAKDNP